MTDKMIRVLMERDTLVWQRNGQVLTDKQG